MDKNTFASCAGAIGVWSLFLSSALVDKEVKGPRGSIGSFMQYTNYVICNIHAR